MIEPRWRRTGQYDWELYIPGIDYDLDEIWTIEMSPFFVAHFRFPLCDGWQLHTVNYYEDGGKTKIIWSDSRMAYRKMIIMAAQVYGVKVHSRSVRDTFKPITEGGALNFLHKIHDDCGQRDYVEYRIHDLLNADFRQFSEHDKMIFRDEIERYPALKKSIPKKIFKEPLSDSEKLKASVNFVKAYSQIHYKYKNKNYNYATS